jgi:hypothetical protein
MKCVNAVDKGVASETYGNATNKGVVRRGFCKLMKRGGLKIDKKRTAGICHGGTEAQRMDWRERKKRRITDSGEWRVTSGERGKGGG